MAKVYKVTDADRKYNTPAWQRFIEGNENYIYVPLKKAKKTKFKENKETSVNA